MKSRLSDSGYTMTELIIAIAVSTIIITVLSGITLSIYRSIQISRATAELSSESQLILHSIVDDTRLAGGLLSNNSISDSYAPIGGWSTNDPSNVLIINSPATDSNANVIYNSETGSPYKNEIIYFGVNGKLSKRTLRNTNAPNNITLTTCPSGTANCKSDKTYTSSLKDLSFTFYDENDQTTSVAENARSVRLSVTLEKKTSGKFVTITNTLRTTLRNI